MKNKTSSKEAKRMLKNCELETMASSSENENTEISEIAGNEGYETQEKCKEFEGAASDKVDGAIKE